MRPVNELFGGAGAGAVPDSVSKVREAIEGEALAHVQGPRSSGRLTTGFGIELDTHQPSGRQRFVHCRCSAYAFSRQSLPMFSARDARAIAAVVARFFNREEETNTRRRIVIAMLGATVLSSACAQERASPTNPTSMDQAMLFRSFVQDAGECALSVVDGRPVFAGSVGAPAATCPDAAAWVQ